MRCESCGREFDDLYEEMEKFWDDLLDAGYIDDSIDEPWVYGNVCWQCANDVFMARYIEDHPSLLNKWD